MTKEDKQDEKPVSYEQQPDEDKSDYTPKETYEPQTSDRRGFLKRTGTAVVVGLGGILFGKKALADGIDGIVGEEEGLKKVTSGYDRIGKDNSGGIDNCYPGWCHPDSECSPYNPNCGPNCSPCIPDCNPFTDCSPECEPYTPCLPNCTPKTCEPHCTP